MYIYIYIYIYIYHQVTLKVCRYKVNDKTMKVFITKYFPQSNLDPDFDSNSRCKYIENFEF